MLRGAFQLGHTLITLVR